jgi:lipopolysaccharide heptosyltransferase II
MIDERWAQARRVLVVRLDNLGDVLLATPAIHAIRSSLPEAALTLLASPSGAQAGRLNPDLDEVIVHEAPWIDPWQVMPLDPGREQEMIETLRERRFDGAVIFTSFRQSPLPAAYLCYLAGIPLRLAASIDGPGSLLTSRHRHPDRMMHEVERGLDLVRAVGFTTDEDGLVLRVPADARDWARQWAADTVRRPLVVVHPGCTMPARTYPWDQYAAVIDLLVTELGASIALTGSDAEQDLVERIIARLRPESRQFVHPFAGNLPFGHFCALIEEADLTVTNNTGPMHVAAAIKTPVVALFALTNPPEQWRPWQVAHRLLNHEVPCRLCYSRICPVGHQCLRLITPDMVIDAASELLEARSGLVETRQLADIGMAS